MPVLNFVAADLHGSAQIFNLEREFCDAVFGPFDHLDYLIAQNAEGLGRERAWGPILGRRRRFVLLCRLGLAVERDLHLELIFLLLGLAQITLCGLDGLLTFGEPPFREFKPLDEKPRLAVPRLLTKERRDLRERSVQLRELGRDRDLGSSGGGLFDDRGNLIGVTTFTIQDSQNLNFAIAASQFWR